MDPVKGSSLFIFFMEFRMAVSFFTYRTKPMQIDNLTTLLQNHSVFKKMMVSESLSLVKGEPNFRLYFRKDRLALISDKMSSVYFFNQDKLFVIKTISDIDLFFVFLKKELELVYLKVVNKYKKRSSKINDLLCHLA
jgi:hypothetical protein